MQLQLGDLLADELGAWRIIVRQYIFDRGQEDG